MKTWKIVSSILSIVLFVLVFSLIFSDSTIIAKKKTKLSAKTKTIYKGKTAKIKILNNKKKVKWSVSNKKIKIVKKSKKYAKIKGVKKGTSYLKAKIGRKTYKCKIKVKKKKDKENTYEEKPTIENIEYKIYNSGKSLVGIFTNQNGVDVTMQVRIFYYLNGSIVDVEENTNYAFESGSSCALEFESPVGYYDTYKANLTVKKGSNLICKSSEISVDFNYGYDEVIVKAINNSKTTLSFVTIAVVFYDEYGGVIGYDYGYADCKIGGSVDYLKFYFPYDDNYDTVIPERCEVFVNNAYTYTWIK